MNLLLFLLFAFGRCTVINLMLSPNTLEGTIQRAVPLWESITGHKINITMFPSYLEQVGVMVQEFKISSQYDGWVMLSSHTGLFAECIECGSVLLDLSNRINDTMLAVKDGHFFFFKKLCSGMKLLPFFVKQAPLTTERFTIFR